MEGFQYIDDSFVVADTFDTCQQSLQKLTKSLEESGFVIHPEKSVMIPTRQVVFLGFRLDSDSFIVFLTEEKEKKLPRAALDLLEKAEPLSER